MLLWLKGPLSCQFNIYVINVNMKLQLEKKERDRKKETESKKDGDERTNQLDLELPVSRSLGKINHQVKSYIYSERVSFDIAF